MTGGSLFSGIGGMDKGFEDAGIEIRWQVENDRYCRKVLEKHWPGVRRYGDVEKVKTLPEIDLLFGGFPCQPVSIASDDRMGIEDERWLWPEFQRVIDLIYPRWVVIENVTGLQTAGFEEILEGLAQGGYDAEWDCLPASAFGAPHMRYRVFILAYPRTRATRWEEPRVFNEKWRLSFKHGDFIASHAAIHEGSVQRVYAKGKTTKRNMGVTRLGITHGRAWPVEPGVGRVAYGIPARVDRLKGLGNAVVPRVAEWIGRRIIEYEIEGGYA